MSSRRMQREAATIEVMILLYCRDHHRPAHGLCSGCTDLLHYARRRLSQCPFQGGKTSCGKCPIHCYQPKMREKIREVMRYSGPRMMLCHPLLAFMHLLDGFRKRPVLPDR
ncbi:MAG: nitrous oxide-stimulated promoter family protein [Proteobacteria bacterium]|nr:nitrous oxide-stimulated promoter family protein [Pseudomonadota bacterium]MBU1060235.1 nitrous oxide-stimulated promoter family protein [Pseudomonadota bacterium]